MRGEGGEGNRLSFFLSGRGAEDNHYCFQRMGSSHTNARRREAIDYYYIFFFLWGGGREIINHYFLQKLERSHTNAGREGKGREGNRLLLLFFSLPEGGIRLLLLLFPWGGAGEIITFCKSWSHTNAGREGKGGRAIDCYYFNFLWGGNRLFFPLGGDNHYYYYYYFYYYYCYYYNLDLLFNNTVCSRLCPNCAAVSRSLRIEVGFVAAVVAVLATHTGSCFHRVAAAVVAVLVGASDGALGESATDQ